jgi:hypothetical protein
MTPHELAAEHAARRRARLTRIRKTVAAVSVCVFIVLFSGIYVQMAAGRDPVLGSKTTVTKQAAKAKAKATTTSTPSSSSFSTGSDDSFSTSSQPAPVTTSQS